MIKIDDDMWEKLEERVSKIFPLLVFHDILDESEINNHDLPAIDATNTIYVYQHRRAYNIFAVGTVYTRLFTYKYPSVPVMIDAMIDFVSLRKGEDISFIPEGYGGLCRIYFPDGLPNEIALVPKGTNNKLDLAKHDVLHLTTEDVMNALLGIMLETLVDKEKGYQFIKDAFFPTQAEFENFQEEHKTKIVELSAIWKEKRQIEWALMSEEERNRQRDYNKRLKEKYKED